MRIFDEFGKFVGNIPLAPGIAELPVVGLFWLILLFFLWGMFYAYPKAVYMAFRNKNWKNFVLLLLPMVFMVCCQVLQVIATVIVFFGNYYNIW